MPVVERKPWGEHVTIPPSRNGTEPTPSRRRRAGGLIPGAAIAAIIDVAVPILAFALVLLSIIGTYYGPRGVPAPLFAPLVLLAQLWRDLGGLGLAVLGQLALTVLQWGGRHKAREDRRWWAAYVAALALSVWWNWGAFGPPLIAAGVPWVLALGLVVAGDVFPELAMIRE